MKCPYCGDNKSKVIDKRKVEDSNRRRRECLRCGRRFTTYEEIKRLDLIVVKRDGRREPFDREKIVRGIMRSSYKRAIPESKIEEIADRIESEFLRSGREEIRSSEVGDKVMRELKKLDEVVYVRFASVYRKYDDIRSFEKELEELETKLKDKDYKKGLKAPRKIKKRDGRKVPFDRSRIVNAIFKATEALENGDMHLAESVTDKVVSVMAERYGAKGVPDIEEIQDIIERVLIKEGHGKLAKAYILYRAKRAEVREIKQTLINIEGLMDSYLDRADWRVNENSNIGYSLSGLMMYITSSVMAQYVLNKIYPSEISDAHRNGDMHIHDLSMGISGYCAGWSIRQILEEGFNGVPGKTESKPPKHLDAATWQLINFIGTLQNEWAGAQAFSSFDTYLAPFVRTDNLTYAEVKQIIQGFVFNMNVPSRWGGQTPFSNITFDWVVPDDMKDQKTIVAGKRQEFTYGDCQKEMDMLNRAFIEVMIEGDMKGRVFTFPIPTYNITKDFDWDSENAKLLFEMTAKYGIPYFQNFVNSNLNPSDVRSMCCRLQMDMRQLRMKGNGLFGASELTGSQGVVTINLPRLGHLADGEEDFFKKLSHLMVLAKNSLEIKRELVQNNMDKNLMPFSKRYLGSLHNHFSTIGINGMNECLLNFIDKDISTSDGKAFAIKVLDFMNERLKDFQEETSHIFNLEATPAEGTSYRFAKIDKEKYPEIVVANEDAWKEGAAPYYTNSTHLPVDYTYDLFEALELQDELQTRYTGGTVLHGFMGESISDAETCKKLVKRIAYNYKLPYFTITPTFSICPVHGYLKGESAVCPKTHSAAELKRFGVKYKGKTAIPCEVFSRVVGYFRPVQVWNLGKKSEFKHRKAYNEKSSIASLYGSKETPISTK